MTAGTIASCFTGANISDARTNALEAAVAATTYSDNCVDEEYLLVSREIDGSCNAVITVTVSDRCGNSNSVTYNTRIDVEAPVPPAAPEAASYQCAVDVPAPGQMTAIDNCAGEIVATGVDENNGGSGIASDPLIITRTWTFTDPCGLSSSVSQTITVIDNTAPVVPVLADVNGECEATASAPTTIDNCAGTITGTTLDAVTYNTQGNHVITWSFDDGNGNVSTATQNVVIHDGTAPTLVNCLINVTSSTGPDNERCDVLGTFFSPPSAVDNCLGTVTTSIHMVDADHSIDEEYTGALPAGTRFFVGTTHMTYTFADPNGNSSTCSFDVIVTDNTVPSITCPANISVCDGEPIAITEPVTGDNCGVAKVEGVRSDALALDEDLSCRIDYYNMDSNRYSW